MAWQLILIAILTFIAVALGMQFYFILFRGFAPYFSSKKEIIEKIINEIALNNNDVVCELGCGNAGFLKAVEKKFPKIKKLTGTELLLLPYLISRIQLSLRKTKIRILKKDIHKTNISDADVIYCFLSPKAMRKLKDKFVNECKQGARIISYQFSLPGLEPEKIIDLENNGKDKVYFYTI